MGTVYIDRRGYKYKVMQGKTKNGLHEGYKVHMQRKSAQGNHGWKPTSSRYLPWRETEAEAQEDLDWYAEGNMKVYSKE